MVCLPPRFFNFPPCVYMNFVEKVEDFVRRWPGEKYFGNYRFLPIFFVSGALVEYLMIHWRPNGVNFYDTYKAKKAHEKAVRKWENWKSIEESLKKNA